ncbi:MAG: alpha/beta hydrolase [Mucilaginibacter sp.]
MKRTSNLAYAKIFPPLCLIALFFLNVNAQTDTAFQPKPLGKLVDLGGWKMHLYGTGDKKTGPSIILESGIGDFSFDWSLVQGAVAKFARVYSYDRAGYAWSEMGPKPHTIQQNVYNLHTLLKKANVPRPYLLVGASYGALVVRLFAQQYPDEVAGIILVDGGYEDSPMFINGKKLQPSVDAKGVAIPAAKTLATKTDNELTPETQKFIKDILAQQGLPNSQIDSPYTKLPLAIQKLRLWAVAQINYYAVNDNDYYIEEAALLLNERKKHPYMFNEKPLIVLTQGITNDTDRINKQKEFLMLSHNSKQIVDKKSGHSIQLEDPDLVVDEIRKLTEVITEHKN